MKLRIIQKYNVLNLESYWENLSKNIEISFINLRSKKEYGTGELCSEGGVQRSLLYYAESIGRKYNVNVYKVKVICACTGLCFPQYGSVGLLAIKELMDTEKINLSFEDVCIYAIEKDLSLVTPALDNALHAYYENRTDDIEVNIARACQMKAREIRELLKQGVAAGKAIDAVMKSFKETYDPTKDIYFYSEPDSIDVPDEVRNELRSFVDMWLSWYSEDKDYDIIDAITEYMI